MIDLEDIVRRIVRDEIAKQAAPTVAVVGYVTAEEYAARYSISESTVRAAIRDGRLPVMRIGRAVRIHAGERITNNVRGKTRAEIAAERADARLARR